MRGGRFQQKTSEDASLRNAEALFESRPVVDIREVEANTRREIEEKKEELRQLVGASYRDLIDSADSIVRMKLLCETVTQNINSMEAGFQTLKNKVSVPPAPPDIDKEKKRREKLYGIGTRVKYIVDTPEKIWGCLDEHMYLEGAQRYFRAREVQTLLSEIDGKSEKKELMSQFPLLRHQWSMVETFRGQISHRSRDRLLESGLRVRQYAVALAAVAVIDELDPSQIVSLFFETRRAWLRSHLRMALVVRSRERKNVGVNSATKIRERKGEKVQSSSAVWEHQVGNAPVGREQNDVIQQVDVNSGDLKDNVVPDINAIATVFYKAANIIQISLCQAGQLFLEVNGDPPLFFSTVLNSPPGSQLFGGIPNPEDETHLWKLHWEKLEARMVTLSNQFISEKCMSWIRTCQKDITAECKVLLELVECGSDLAKIEHIVRTECDSKKALDESIEWLEGAFGKSVDVPWDYVTALVLKEPLNLWSTLFESMFVERAKGIIDFGLLKIDVEKILDGCLASIRCHNQSLTFGNGSISSASANSSSTEKGKRMDSLSDTVTSSQTVQEEEWLGIPRSYLGTIISQVKNKIDRDLQALLEDSVSFFQAEHNTARSKELVPYLQRNCFRWMAHVINELQTKLLDLEDDLGQSGGRSGKALYFPRFYPERNDRTGASKKTTDFLEVESGEASPIVQEALFLGRVLVAFSQHSWTLPAILHPFKSWNSKESALENALPWASLRSGLSWLDEEEFGSESRHSLKAGLLTGSWKTDDSTSDFIKLQLALRYSSLVAHSIWVSWSIERLTAVLVRSLLKDDDLASPLPLKGWEETVLKQKNEGGDEFEVRLPLPAMPSPYIISFLFRSCQEIYRTGGHALDKAVLQLFAWRLLEKVLMVYEDFISRLQVSKLQVSEKGLLQVLFDLRFLGDVLSGGQRLSLDSTHFLKDEPILASMFSSSNLARTKELMLDISGTGQARQTQLDTLQKKLSGLLDPIDWATYEPHLWENVQQSYQRCAVLFGFLVQLNRLYRDTAQRPPLSTESNILRVSASVPRFTYLPISTPSLTKKTTGDESGLRKMSLSSSDHSSKFLFEDESGLTSAGAAKPLLMSFMNQVGSRFGEGTFKLGSMLTDGQVSRLKDRSAAAISTFGEILPAQAAGLFSSFTAGTARSETYY